MFAALINQGGDRSVLNIIKATTDQWKSIIGEVKNCGRKVKLHVKPRFYGVLVGRRDIRKVVCHQRTHMTGDKLRRKKLFGISSLESRQQVPSDNGCKNDRCGETQPTPRCAKRVVRGSGCLLGNSG